MELYSSEGCSSCPPADEWLAGLRKNPGLWSQFVPIEFHVDYWNYLGWTDRFSKNTFTARQRSYAQDWGKESVYTPGFVLNGKEWRPDGSQSFQQNGQAVGILQAKKLGENRFLVSFAPKSLSNKKFTITGALLGDGFQTDVRSGENSGRKLTHEFVVIDLKSSPAKVSQISVAGDSSSANPVAAEIDFTENGKTLPKSFSVAFWITDSQSSQPLQAVGGDL